MPTNRFVTYGSVEGHDLTVTDVGHHHVHQHLHKRAAHTQVLYIDAIKLRGATSLDTEDSTQVEFCV